MSCCAKTPVRLSGVRAGHRVRTAAADKVRGDQLLARDVRMRAALEVAVAARREGEACPVSGKSSATWRTGCRKDLGGRDLDQVRLDGPENGTGEECADEGQGGRDGEGDRRVLGAVDLGAGLLVDRRGVVHDHVAAGLAVEARLAERVKRAQGRVDRV